MKLLAPLFICVIMAIICALIPNVPPTVKHLTWWSSMAIMALVATLEALLHHSEEKRRNN